VSRRKEPTLIDLAPVEQWEGSRELVPLPRDECPECGDALSTTTAAQLPLLRHGGYGEIRSHRVLSCSCGYVIAAGFDTTNPRSVP
jgi:hypothetical protein